MTPSARASNERLHHIPLPLEPYGPSRVRVHINRGHAPHFWRNVGSTEALITAYESETSEPPFLWHGSINAIGAHNFLTSEERSGVWAQPLEGCWRHFRDNGSIARISLNYRFY